MSPEPRSVKTGEEETWTSDAVKQYTDERVQELQRAVDVAREAQPPHVRLQEYFEAILNEQRRGLMVAEQEREKAARALRIELDRAISEGDRALREHIDQQFQQIRAALISADLLEIERIKSIDAKVDGVQREIVIQFHASEKAIEKAENANERRFESVNEFRAQLADRERAQTEQMSALVSDFVRGDVVEAQIADLRRSIQDLTDKVNKLIS